MSRFAISSGMVSRCLTAVRINSWTLRNRAVASGESSCGSGSGAPATRGLGGGAAGRRRGGGVWRIFRWLGERCHRDAEIGCGGDRLLQGHALDTLEQQLQYVILALN